jgi:dienelactone hydrolase
VTGPSDASQAILVIYDIFGYFPQTLQGADILAHSDKEHQYQIFMPDFFMGSPADISWYPPDTKEKGEKLGAFIKNEAEPSKTLSKIPGVLEDAEKGNSSIKSWGIVGYCWGGKMVSLSSAGDTKFKAAAELHPSMVDPEDAKKISIPMCMLASKDEDAKLVDGFEANLKGTKHVETFGDQVHGWMAARADLADKRVKEEYERGYKTLLTFFHDNL